jgi:hypothetical protein
MMKGVLVCALLVALCAAVPTQLTYKIGTNYVYNVSGEVQNNGYDTNVNDYLPGFYSYMEAVMVMQPIKEDTISYVFVMNLFGTVVSVSNKSGSASPAEPKGEALGEDMYFYQLKTGEITEIQYYSNDPIYYVDVKLGAINAFQTSIVAAGKAAVVLEVDPIGNHSTQVSGAVGPDGSLVLTKVFSQVDFSAFPDHTVTPKNMLINVQAVTGVHAEGYVINSTLRQTVIMTNGAPSTAKRALTNSTGFDTQLSALGTLSIRYAPNEAFSVKSFAAPNASELIKTNMFDLAAVSGSYAKTRAFTINLYDAMSTILSKKPVTLSALRKVGDHFRYNPQDVATLVRLFEGGFLDIPLFRDRLIFVLTVIQHEEYLLKYGLSSDNCDIMMRAVLAAPQFTSSPDITRALVRIAALSECPFAQGSAKTILGSKSSWHLQTSDFPFNRSHAAGVNFGGKVAAAQFDASVFAGTNFNCKNPSFNYEAAVEGSATAVLFGYSQQAFDAKIIYGQENGASLADAITLSVWGNKVYDQPIPAPACKQETFPLAHTSPGFSVEHTLWVSIIPIVFSASANLALTAAYGWDLCPTQLSADIYLSGTGSISASGSSYADLLLLGAGFDLQAAFDTAIIPNAYIHGSTCDIGFEIDANNLPETASLVSYYRWEECKVLFFDCKWGNYNDQTWWSYNAPAKNRVLFQQIFNITL